MKQQLTDEEKIRIAQNKYLRAWCRAHPDNHKRHVSKYWLKRFNREQAAADKAGH
jgi:hypothetical protein